MNYVLGDIHGEVEALNQVFNLAHFDFEDDYLIQIGDICDRGLSSYECVEVLKNCKHLILIQGNHDIWFKEAMNGIPLMDWYNQGGKETLSSYNRNNAHPMEHKDFYALQIPYFIDENNNCFVHGGFDRKVLIEEQSPHDLAWDRELVNQMMSCKSGKLKTANKFNKIFIGHTPTLYWAAVESKTESGIIVASKNKITTPIKRGGVINIDTGSGKGGKLTLLNIDTEEYFQSDLQDKTC